MLGQIKLPQGGLLDKGTKARKAAAVPTTKRGNSLYNSLNDQAKRNQSEADERRRQEAEKRRIEEQYKRHKYEEEHRRRQESSQEKSRIEAAKRRQKEEAAKKKAAEEAKKRICHVVKEGDSLTKLAEQYGVSVEDIKEANNNKDEQISVGQKLIIPKRNNKVNNEEKQTRLSTEDSLYNNRLDLDNYSINFINSNDTTQCDKLYQAVSLTNAGEYNQAEALIYEFIDEEHSNYMTARAFILLADVNIKKGNLNNAIEYLKLLKGNYPGNEEDIFNEIDSRLELILPKRKNANLNDSTKSTYHQVLRHPVKRCYGLSYIVAEPGDTYQDIANEFNIKLSELIDYNDLDNNSICPKEDEIIYLRKKYREVQIDEDQYQVMEDGETLWYISQIFGIRLKELAKLNNMNPDVVLKEGDVIKLK